MRYVVLLLLTASAFASERVYDQTATLKFVSTHPDLSASYEVDGETYNYHCYTTPGNVECHEGVGGSYVYEMDDGTRLYVSTEYHTGGGLLGVKNPLLDFQSAHIGDKEAKIRFRFIEHCSVLRYGDTCSFSTDRRMFCIPYTVNGKEGGAKEACYAIRLVSRVPVRVPAQTQPPASTETMKQAVQVNSEAAKGSPAAAAALAETGHISTPEELADLVQKGLASKCAVVTTPPGAEIDIDGNKMGVSPIVFVLLKRGDTPRTVSIKMDGYKTVEKKFVPDGKPIPIGLTMEKQ